MLPLPPLNIASQSEAAKSEVEDRWAFEDPDEEEQRGRGAPSPSRPARSECADDGDPRKLVSVELEEHGGSNAINTAPEYLLDQLNAVLNRWLSLLQQEPMDEEGDHDDLLRDIAAVLRTSSPSCVAALFNAAASRQWGFDDSGAAFMVRPSWLCEDTQHHS